MKMGRWFTVMEGQDVQGENVTSDAKSALWIWLL